MPAWGELLTSVAVVGVLALILRWAFSGHSVSLVERRSRRSVDSDYGLMVSVASPSTFIEGEVARRRLADAGIRASLVTTSEGPRLMVLREDEPAARQRLAAS